jgi:tetratricopeptide (TPR) repeat protein
LREGTVPCIARAEAHKGLWATTGPLRNRTVYDTRWEWLAQPALAIPGLRLDQPSLTLSWGIESMNDDELILAELRKIGAWADMQRRITKWSFIVLAVLVPGMIIFGVIMEHRFKTSLEDIASPQKIEKPSWNDVDWNVRRANLDEAIRIGEELIKKMPVYAEGHYRLAAAYLAAGKTEQAREHYAQAFHLFPSEENGKSVVAIEKRIKESNPQPVGAATRSQPVGLEVKQTSAAAPSHR